MGNCCVQSDKYKVKESKILFFDKTFSRTNDYVRNFVKNPKSEF